MYPRLAVPEGMRPLLFVLDCILTNKKMLLMISVGRAAKLIG